MKSNQQWWISLCAVLESGNDMGHKKRKIKRGRQSSVIVDLQRQRKKARSLGYENVEEYEKGLNTIKRLLKEKNN